MQEHGRDLTEDFERYEELRGEGKSKEQAQNTSESEAEEREQQQTASDFEKWPTKELHRCASETGIEGCDQMSRKDLIKALQENKTQK